MIGNVLVAPMAAADEYTAVQNLKAFLEKYTVVLDFSLDRWQRVIFVIHIHNHRTTTSAHNQQLRENNNDKDDDSASKKKKFHKNKDAYTAMGYSLEDKGTFTVVKIPHSFKGKMLMPFLSSFLPIMKFSII